MRAHRLVPLVAALALAAGIGACSGSAATSPPSSASTGSGGPPVTVTIAAKDIAFQPTSFAVPAGRPLEVTFHNQDAGVPHNLVLMAGPALDDELVKTEIIAGLADQQVSIPGLIPGTYRFSCSVHPNMTADLTVAP